MLKLICLAGAVIILNNCTAQKKVSMDELTNKLTAKEKQIASEINKQMLQTMQLLEQLVNINSGTHNIEGVKNIGAILKKEKR